MRTIITDVSFKRAFRRRFKNRPQLQDKIMATLDLLVLDPFAPSLDTHKLQGNLKGYWSCSVEYDCRIVFRFTALDGEPEEAIVLVDVGSHDEVY
jgi:addiction module RelE/StbE family toxin